MKQLRLILVALVALIVPVAAQAPLVLNPQGHNDVRIVNKRGDMLFRFFNGQFLSYNGASTGPVYRTAVRLASITNVTISTLEDDDTMDSVGLDLGDRVVLTGQTTASENGIYVIGATNGTTVRADDMNVWGEVPNAFVQATAGTLYAGTVFKTTVAPLPAAGVIGTTSMTWAAESGAAALALKATLADPTFTGTVTTDVLAVAGAATFSTDVNFADTIDLLFDDSSAHIITVNDMSTADTAGGALNISSADGGATATGTAGAGGALTGAGGAGGAASGNGTGGAGGAVTRTGGVGGAAAGTGAAVGGAGGATTTTAGAGGAAAGTSVAGAGGAASLVSGAGGAKTGTGTANGGAGGAVTVTGGVGGATASTGASTGGAGAAITVASGTGGAASAAGGTSSGGAAGAVAVTGGNGGATAASATGAGGTGAGVTVTAGNGGAVSAGSGTGGNAGNVVLVPGTGGTSSGGTAGVDGALYFRSPDGAGYLRKMAAPTAKTTNATLTAAEMSVGWITVDGAASATSTQTTPTGTELLALFPGIAAGDCFDFQINNISTDSAEVAILAAGTDVSIVGSARVASNASNVTNNTGTFRFRYTGTTVWVAYRLN